jgi:hypothetical protein
MMEEGKLAFCYIVQAISNALFVQQVYGNVVWAVDGVAVGDKFKICSPFTEMISTLHKVPPSEGNKEIQRRCILCFDKEKYLQIKVVGKTCQYTN